jgi:hypothetical protein
MKQGPGIGLMISPGKRQSSSAPVIPELVSAVSTSEDIYLTFNQEMDETSVPALSCFIVKINGSIAQINEVAYYNHLLDLWLGTTLVYGDIVTVSYTQPETNPLQSLTGGKVASFVDYPVTNNIEAP